MIYRTDEDQNWFYVNEGRRQGPLDRRGLIQALLAHDVPEKTLVWRSGLHAWTKAGDLQELRLELPPPLPKPEGPADDTPRPAPPPLPTEDGTMAASGVSPEGEADDDEEEDDEEDKLEPAPPDASGAPSEGRRRRRRRRKRKHSEKTSHNPRVLELLALFLVLALVLWFLLRRMNRVPEGTIIYQGRLRPVPEAVASSALISFGTPPPPRPRSWGPR
jgi:GYF domain 2